VVSFDGFPARRAETFFKPKGVVHVEVNLANGRARVQGDLPSGAQPLIAALASEDYPAQLATGANPIQASSAEGCQTAKGKKGGCCCS
jgi:hypothetical protein